MHHVTIDAAQSFGFGDGVEHRAVGTSLEANDVAMNRYRIAPNTRLPWGLHAHYDQEELFVTTAGTVTFETLDGTLEVPAGEAIRFEPGEFQAGSNQHDAPAVCLAIGAPTDSDDIRVPSPCPDCASDERRIDLGDDALTCLSCGATEAAACDACGASQRCIQLADDDSLVDCCRACGDEVPVDGFS